MRGAMVVPPCVVLMVWPGLMLMICMPCGMGTPPGCPLEGTAVTGPGLDMITAAWPPAVTTLVSPFRVSWFCRLPWGAAPVPAPLTPPFTTCVPWAPVMGVGTTPYTGLPPAAPLVLLPAAAAVCSP